jgi:riboflavin kinase/FMN adenylyltransferase
MGSNVEVIRNRPGEHARTEGIRSIVTIGNFDGMHLGHQALIRRCRELTGRGDQVAVVSFEPLPRAVFQPDAAPPRLSTVYQKLELLCAENVDLLWLMRFDAELAALPARDFIFQVIVSGLGARRVVVGADFRFGHRRQGDVNLLRALGSEFGFETDTVSAVYLGEERVSSSSVRLALSEGDFKRAAALLGRPFRMEGHVVQGRQLGRTLGYATANLRIRARPCPLQGIFAVKARFGGRGGADVWQPAVASLGWRPTVGGQEPLLETHLFDFEGELYGRRLEVEFVAKLREESHFGSLEELVKQMRRDEVEARAILENTAWPD